MRIEHIVLRNLVIDQLCKMAQRRRTAACPLVHRFSLVRGKHESIIVEKRPNSAGTVLVDVNLATKTQQ